MLRTLINFGQALPVSAGVSCRIDSEGNSTYSLIVLTVKRDVVTIKHKNESISGIDELIRQFDVHVPKGSRVHLNLDGDNILIKTVDTGDRTKTIREIVEKVFPFALSDDFICQAYINNYVGYVAVIRSGSFAQFNALVESYCFASFSIGPFVLGALSPFVEDSQLTTTKWTASLESGSVKTIEPSNGAVPADTTIGNDALPTGLIMPYASAISNYSPDNSIHNDELSLFNDGRKKYDLLRIGYRYSVITVVTLLALLLINSVVNMQLLSAVLAMESRVEENSSVKKESELEATVQNDLNAFNDSGWRDNNLPLFYADQIAGRVPQGVQLSLLTIGKAKAVESRMQRELHYDQNIILIKGRATEAMVLQDFLMQLKGYAWIKEIKDQRFEMNANRRDGIFEFTIVTL